MKKVLSDEEVEREIREAFELNYELLQLEGGHALTPEIKNIALQQVLFYWKKLRNVAEKVTDTEVKLTLPEQLTPEGRRFVIEGIVDIVKEEGDTWMYDIKTHDADYVRANKDLYEKQLNVYAHIWQNLRRQPLDHTAIIATSFPDALNDAIRTGDQKAVDQLIEKWNPLVEISCDKSKVETTISDFGEVVDKIEAGKFSPPPLSKLSERIRGDTQIYATRVCRNCDARWSCSSYREYALSGKDRTASFYRKFMTDLGDDVDVEDWKTVNLEASAENGVIEAEQAPATSPSIATPKVESIVELQSGSVSFQSLFTYIKKVPEIPHKNDAKYGPYKAAYTRLTASVADIPGWYVWVKKEKSKTSIIYVGQSQHRKTSTLRSRIKEEFLDEYVALWGTVHSSTKMAKMLDKKYGGKYTKEIERAARKAGATHLVWCGAEELTDHELTTIEYRLIEVLKPTANTKRLKPHKAYDALFKAAKDKIEQEISTIG